MRWVAGIALAVALGATATIYMVSPETAYRASLAGERWRAGMVERTTVVNGLTWSYLDGGDGPVLLLLHGFGADKYNWVRIARHLTPHFRVIAPDLIGFGKSARPPEADYGVEAQARRVIALLDALQIDEYHLGGNSMGGHIAGVVAAEKPRSVRSLLLIAPAGVAGAEASELFGLIQAGSNPLIPDTPTDFEATLAFVFSDRPFIPDAIQEHLAREQAGHRELLARIFSDLRFHSPPLESYVAGLAVPTLIVWGNEDRVLHPSGGAVLAGIMPNAALRLVEGDGHLPMIESPDRTADLYLDWATQP